MQAASIIITSVVAAILYGIIHDLVTARICVEYFTISHPQLIDSDSPTVLAIFWGVVATWWVGLALGIGLAIAARAGRRPKLTCAELLRPIAILLCIMFAVATLAGLIGYFTSDAGIFRLTEPLASWIPKEKHVEYLTVGWAHSASYLTGFSGSISLWFLTWKRRSKL